MLDFIKATAIATTFAVVPMTASAASFITSGITGPFQCGGIAGLPAGQIDVLSGATLAGEFFNGDAAGGLCFDLTNSSGSAAAVTLAVATVNQGGKFWGFRGGVELGGGTVSALWAEGEARSETLTFNIAAGDSVLFDFEYGQAYSSGLANPTIDFAVFGATVPVPAAGLLLLAALGAGGFAARRRKTA